MNYHRFIELALSVLLTTSFAPAPRNTYYTSTVTVTAMSFSSFQFTRATVATSATAMAKQMQSHYNFNNAAAAAAPVASAAAAARKASSSALSGAASSTTTSSTIRGGGEGETGTSASSNGNGASSSTAHNTTLKQENADANAAANATLFRSPTTTPTTDRVVDTVNNVATTTTATTSSDNKNNDHEEVDVTLLTKLVAPVETEEPSELRVDEEPLESHQDSNFVEMTNDDETHVLMGDPDRIQLSGELFEAVQHNRIFSDSKNFVDMLATLLPSTVLAKYRELKHNHDFDLGKFVTEHFELPEALHDDVTIDPHDNCRDHIRDLWPLLFRKADTEHPRIPHSSLPHSSLLPLPYPYVVPGGRFRETYYWDSYFTAHGLLADGHADMALHLAQNFRHMIQVYGHIPNGNRFYYLSRSQPPFYIPLVSVLAHHYGDENIVKDFYQEAVKEHSFWMDNVDAGAEPNRRSVTVEETNGTQQYTLNRYWDDNPVPREESWIEDKMEFESTGLGYEEAPAFYRHVRAACESGWDFTSRWLADKSNLATIETTNILPVDLNTVLWFAESKLAEWSHITGHTEKAHEFQAMADRRKTAINDLMWDAEEGFFFDYHLIKQKHNKCRSLAAIYPLYFKMADQSQAEAVAEHLEKHFLKDGGLVTTTQYTGQQWDAPNGWAPLQWMAVVGLENYGFRRLAETIRNRWLQLNERVYAESGKMVEKYNVVDMTQRGGGGEYPLQDGFGWTNGVFSALAGRYDRQGESP